MSCPGKKIALNLMSRKPKKLQEGQTAPQDSLKLREGDLALLQAAGRGAAGVFTCSTGSFAPSGTKLHH